MQSVARRLLDGFEMSCAAQRTARAADDLLLRRLLVGSLQPFFFLRAPVGVFFHRAQTADLLVDFKQLSAEFAKALEVVDLALGLAAMGGRNEGLADAFPVDLPCQTVVGTMGGLAGLMAAASRFAAAAADGGDGSATEVTQIEDTREDSGPLTLERGDGIRHGAPPMSDRITT